MTDPNRQVPGYHNPDNVDWSNEFIDIGVDDYGEPGGEDIMLNVGGNIHHPWESQDTQFVNDPSQAGPSGVHDQSTGLNAGSFDPGNSAFGIPTKLLDWPDLPPPYDCTFCRVLRTIIHTKGEVTTKLEIHGRIGMVCHGILEIHSGGMTIPNMKHRTFDFSQKSISDYKEFLVEYFDDRREANFTIVNDPLLKFYDTLCARSEWDYVYDNIHQGPPGNLILRVKSADTDQPEDQNDESGAINRTHTEHNEFVKTVTIQECAKYFHLSQEEAAERIGVSAATIKGIRRNAGLERWPSRKVNAILKKITETTNRINSLNSRGRGSAQQAEAELQKLQEEKAKIYGPYQ